MSGVLRQSTAVALSFGPFVSPSDGVTPQTGLVSALDHVSTGIMLSKNGGALAVRHASVTASTYDAYGNYIVTLDATDTNTVGRLRVQFAAAASCLPVWRDFDVIEEAVYDALFAASAAGYSTFAGGAVASVTGAVGSVTGLTASDVGAIKAKTDNLPSSPAAVGSAMTLTTGERTAIANEVEAQIIDETDSEKVLTAITNKIAAVNPSLSGLTLAAIASQVRTELATELARIDAAVSTRLATAGYTAPLDAAAIRTAIGLAAANLDVQLDALPTNAELATALGTADDPALAQIALVKAKTDLIPAAPAAVGDIPTAGAIADAVWDEAISGHSIAGSTGEALSNGGSDLGAGAIAWTYTLTRSDNDQPIADADVWVTTDSAGSNVIASGRTNQLGVVTFMLDAGTVYLWKQKSGFNFTNPTTKVVS